MAPVIPSEIAQALGFWPVLSETAPTPSTAHGVPIVWIDKTTTLTSVPVLPAQPAWDDRLAKYTIPSLVGVEYVVDGVVTPAGTHSSTPGARVLVVARATPGYHIPGVYQWNHPFPDESVVAFLGSDSFAGANAATIHGRAWDNALGGSLATTWTRRATADAWKIDTNRLVATGVADWVGATVPAPNLRVRFELLSPVVHGAFQIVLRAVSVTGLQGIQVNINPTGFTVGSTPITGTPGSRHSYSPGGTLGAGVYELQWYEGGLTLTAPGKTPHWIDITDVKPSSLGSTLVIRNSVATAPLMLDSLTVHSLGAEA